MSCPTPLTGCLHSQPNCKWKAKLGQLSWSSGWTNSGTRLTPYHLSSTWSPGSLASPGAIPYLGHVGPLPGRWRRQQPRRGCCQGGTGWRHSLGTGSPGTEVGCAPCLDAGALWVTTKVQWSPSWWPAPPSPPPGWLWRISTPGWFRPTPSSSPFTTFALPRILSNSCWTAQPCHQLLQQFRCMVKMFCQFCLRSPETIVMAFTRPEQLCWVKTDLCEAQPGLSNIVYHVILRVNVHDRPVAINYWLIDWLVLCRKNKLKTQWPILPHDLFWGKNEEIVNFNFINHSRYYSYGYAESL